MEFNARNLPTDELTALLAADQDVELAMLFGSSAVGELRRDSDVDVAVLTRSRLTPKRRREIIGAIAQIVGRPVDLVDFSHAPEPFRSLASQCTIDLSHVHASATASGERGLGSD